jgi:hypothetical protein
VSNKFRKVSNQLQMKEDFIWKPMKKESTENKLGFGKGGLANIFVIFKTRIKQKKEN